MKCQGQVHGHECGRTLTPDVTFCPDCGTRREKNHTFTCLSCGKALEFGAKFCSTCGTRIDPNQFAIQPDICKGKNDDGSLCEYELIPGLNFCPLCGTKPGEQDVSEQGNQNSAVKRDVNPDVKIPGAEKISDSANGQLSDQPLCQVVKTETTLFNTERPEDETSTPGTAAVNAETDVNDETELPCKVHNDEVSAPVPCSEHPMEVEGSSGGEWHQHSQQCAVEEGEWESHFAEYANQPMVEKEIIMISQTKLPLNNDPSSSQSCDQSKERSTSTSDSDSKPTSDGIRVYAAKTEEKTGNEAEDKENASNPNQAEITEETNGTPVDHPLKAELDSATKTGTKEKNVEDKKAQSKGEGQCKNAAAGKGKANKEMAEKEQKNSSQSAGQKQGGKGGNKSTEPKTKGDQSAGEQTKPKQPDAKKSYAQAASKTKAGQNGAGNNALLNSMEKVSVVFHVIISDMWDTMDPATCQAYISIGHPHLGNFSSAEERHKMKFVRKTAVGFLYEGKVLMPKHVRDSEFPYKYTVKKMSKKNNQLKVVWEVVQQRYLGTAPYLVNRIFTIPQNRRGKAGTWHRFDGVSYFPGALKESGFNRLRGFFGYGQFSTKFRQDVIAAAEVFLPSVEDIYKASLLPAANGQSMESFLDQTAQIMSSLMYQMLDTTLQSIDNAMMMQVLDTVLVTPVIKKMTATKATVTLGVFLLLLVEHFRIDLKINCTQTLCFSLLIRPEINNTTCADLDMLTSHYPANMMNKSELAKKVLALIERTDPGGYLNHASDPSWLCCVPLLHFLEEKSFPYQDLEPSASFMTPEWWGLEHLTRRKRSFMDATMTVNKEVMKMLEPAFQVDPLFVRTFVGCLGLEALLPVLVSSTIPVDVMAATLTHHVQEANYLFDEQRKQINTCLGRMVPNLKKIHPRNSDCWDMKGVSCSAEIIHKLHKALTANERNLTDDTILLGTHLVFVALDQVAVLEEKMCQQNDGVSAHGWRQDVKAVAANTCQWLSFVKSSARTRRQTLQMWDNLLAKVQEDLNNSHLKETVKKLLAEGFEKQLNQLSPDQKLEVYLEQYTVAPAFAGILNKLAFESLDAAFKMDSRHLSQNQGAHLISLLSAFIEQKWRENITREDNIALFVITWGPMVNYLQRFAQKANSDSLSTLAAKHIQQALSCLGRLLDNLTEGNIRVETLQLLTANREQFLALLEAAGHDKASVSRLLDLRGHELQMCITTSKNLDKLLDFCKDFLKTEDLHAVLRNAEEMRDKTHTLPLSSVCDTTPPDSVASLETYKPCANPWKLPADIHAVLLQFGGKITSYVFQKLFCDMAQKTDLSSVGFWRAFQILWKDVSREWQSLCEQMIAGTITLSATEKVFSMFRAEGGMYRFNDIADELHKLDSNASGAGWVDERIKQFTCFTKIKEHVKAASVLLKLKEAYDVEGEFGDIEKICNLGHNRNLPIRDVNSSVLQLCTQLKDIDAQDIDCLGTFVDPRCLDFVKWLRENMKDGVKELNVYVDLAFISAGEEPWAIGRVNCFHAAAIGYAPLIFLEKDKGCKHLLQQCKLVFANVAADPSLPEKLMDSSRYLNWFKDVQKSHGSVEKTSLSQVGNINARGVFRVGGGAKQELSLHSVIQLRVSEEENSEMRNMKEGGGVTPPRRYTYEELLDLQSRLMLVAGQAEKGKENVDRFITIMESLVRLGKTYVQLCSDGCVLFLDWSVEFLCDMKKPVCCVSEFSSQGKLKGHRSHEGGHSKGRGEDLEEFIAGVAGFLEHCHKEWLQYVDKKRKDYPQLNVYTVEQLVFLQQQLVRVGSDDVSQHVYPMLSLLKADCSPQDLEQALQEAMDFIDASQQQPQQQQRQPQSQQQSELPEETQAVDDKETIETFMMEMFDAGFSKPLALRALKEVDVEDVAAGIAWCMEHEDDDEDEQDSETEGSSVDREPQQGEKEEEQRGHKMVGQRLKEWVTRTETITQSAIGWLENMDRRERGTTLKSLVCNLGNVWSKFLETVSSSGMDFLSLEHLGIVLRCLAAKDQRTFERTLPPNFKPKVPNLILCPRREVLNTVTYMYMFPENNPDSLLPQPDEVLLCTENTSFQQVDIFLRRAFFGTQQKVYCLAFADSLDYDVGEKVEKKIKEYTTMSDDRDYKLVVVCATENEYRARIVAAMEKYRRPLPSLSNTNRVRNYLRSRFAHLHGETDGLSASTLDPESLCVRVVRSKRSGVGKTLYKQRLTAKLKRTVPRERRPVSITIPLHGRVADTEDMAACLLPHTLHPGDVLPRIVHLDISYEVQEGVDHLLYNLLVLGRVTDHHGQVWLRSPLDLYLIETMPLLDQKDAQKGEALVHQIFDVLPSLSCWSPQDSLTIMKKLKAMPDYQKHDCLFDDEEFRSEAYQRPFRYLNDLETQGQAQAKQQTNVQLDTAEKKAECLATLLKYCGVVNPSWSELTHFVCFLDKQLRDFEKSVYCGMATTQDLPGFSVFVLRFLIEMSRDFATRSLNVSEESLDALVAEDPEDTDIQQYEMRRTWENSPHPYIFFNPDGHSMTFLGFSIDAASGNLVDQQTGKVLEQGIMSKQLFKALALNRVPLTENFDALPREDRLLRLYRVLGLYDEEIFDDHKQIIDPDNTYELTTDNVKKILAIYMRFRCNIPVIVMGETGCGKTRLVKFLCALQTPRQKDINTMVLVKVHGGITGEDIIKKVKQADKVAQRNAGAIGHRPVYTVLFFDEANTTEAIGVIKEVMCDGTLNGQHSNLSQSLKMVAACNPYRKHSDELIERLENAGLGYHVDAEKTVDKLGRVPMRRLVYRVQPLPQSMLPLVWDFGQLNTRVEELYIRQMVRRYVRNGQLGDLDEEGMNVLCKILMESQEFMRLLADECSFVSLRDVDRALTVTAWFLQQAQESRTLFKLLDRKLYPHKYRDNDDQEESLGSSSLDLVDDEEEEDDDDDDDLSDLTRAVVLALGVCYRACLRSKRDYDEHITKQFQPPFTLPEGVDQFALIIDRCQDVFLDSVRLEDNIARNQALKENVFMMVVCVELRIPLFLVGKPGSSKSLAKTIVSDGMQGNSAYSELFKTLKQAQMVSFQCSPLATADGILGTFRQCAQFQSGKNKDNFVSVVVLDEVGLAEDSPKMPLKTLHPLLEDGCPGDEVPEDSKKVAFIGISNWALDPAKMNRGILVQRDVPDQEELIETAKGICSTEDTLTEMNMQTLIQGMAKAYLSIFDEAKLKREFFGLRDFYSLVKMVYAFAAQSKQQPSPRQLIAAIRRNFGGLDSIDPVESFRKELPSSLCKEKRRDGDPDCTPSGLIQAALSGDSMGGESRYLLLLTENYGGLTILSENLLADRRVVPIFGSSFPKDQEYTQICRNINRIKVCMETGQTVILLNLENLYESLYDALNQYYATLGGERYVDLGLGTHRVKCRVHRQFRLIVVAEKQVVYDKFPIPLINRLEKHFLTLNNIMTDAQLAMAQRLEKWAKDFVTPPGVMTRLRTRNRKEEAVGDAFMGYHPDTAPAIVLKVWEELKVAKNPSAQKQVLGECQRMLLWCATPDAVVRSQEEEWGEIYHQEQQHEHLHQYLLQRLQLHSTAMIMAQVTTHSKLLTEQERVELCESLPGVSSITLLSLQAFDTEQQFCQQLRLFFTDNQEGQKLLLVQCDSGDLNQNLIKCAQYCMQDLRPPDSRHHHVVFIIQLPRLAGACFTGFLGGNWHCLHIDDLWAPEGNVPSITVLQTHTPAELIMASASTADSEQLNSNNSSNDSTSSIQPASKIWDEAEKSAESGQPEEMAVDVDDIQVLVEAGPSPTTETVATECHIPHPQGFDPRYVKQLFTSCVQAAAAQVRDTEEGTARATHRITVLLHLIEENKEFFAGLHKLVGSILKQKEICSVEAERWLSREAAKLDSVNKAGTFRSSWMQYVENKVVPVLAGAVAYLDTNHNLDILYNAHTSGQYTPTPEWVGQLWLGVLQGVCQLNYKQLLSVSGKDELDEFTVRHTGAAALPFSACLPFSWLLWDLVVSTICEAKNMQGEMLDTAGSVVEQSTLGRCVNRSLGDSEENLPHLFDLYTCDLLHFTFPLTASQHELLCGCIKKGLQQLDISLAELGLGRGVVALHMLVEQMRGRLQAVLDMSGVRPNAVEALRVGAAGPSAELLNTPDEMTEDIVVLRLLVEEMQPRQDQLSNDEAMKEWLVHYGSVAPVVLRILTDSDAMLVPPIQPAAAAENAQEEEEEAQPVNTLPYGNKCQQQLKAIRCLWARASTLKLFLDFVVPLKQGPEKLHKALGKINMKLMCKLLDEEISMKDKRSLAQIDKFLRHANGFMIKGLLGKVGQCAYCEQKFETAPVELPCKHTLCNSCYRDSCHGHTDAKCPQCEKPVPRNFDPSASKRQDREAVELLGRYQGQISGFLMAVVSQLCFAGKEPPEPEAVRHIFGYIIHKSKGRTLLQTKNMTVHDDLIDPTPVLRSFLLRLLLKHSKEEVYSHLDEFLRNAQEMVDQEVAASKDTVGTPTLLEFSLLIIHCLEDLHHEQEALNSSTRDADTHLLSLAGTLSHLANALEPTPIMLTSLYSLGSLRYALDACVHVVYKAFVAPGTSGDMSDELEDVLTELQELCLNNTTDWPKKFLVKQLCRQYGIQAYSTLAKLAKQQPLLEWIIVQEPANKVEEVADRYLVCSHDYKTIRDQLAQCKLDGDFKDLLNTLQNLPGGDQKELLLLLALHREMTMSVLHPLPQQVRSERADAVKAFIQDCAVLREKALAQQLCNNQLGDAWSSLHVQQTQDLGQQSLGCLLTHLWLTLRPGARPSNLLHPLSDFVFQPATMMNAFLPTMPQDNLQEVLAVLNEKVWQCPNGHRYLIGDCGKPNYESWCPRPCGQKIGGARHIAASQNVENSSDQTQRGHILGSAGQRGVESVPERQLSAVECAVLRFLTHAALYLAASNPAQFVAVSQMVKPGIAPHQTAEFFRQHVQQDMQVLQRVLGRSADDVYLLLHHLCHQMAVAQAGGKAVNLQTKEERDQWEKHFTAKFIAPAVESVDTVVRIGNRAVVSDTRQGESALLKLVYEDEDQTPGDSDVKNLQANPSVWRYRPRITVDHFFRQFHLQVETRKEMKGEYPVLRLFKAQRHIMHALHYVPSILAGQRRLMMQLHRRLDRAEAATLTVAEVLDGNVRTSGLQELLKNFSQAWEIVKEHLIGFQCVTPAEGLVSLPEEYHNASMTTDSPIAVLLPSTQGLGLCSYILLQFLLGRNNDFLQTYCPMVKQRYESLPEVSVKAVTERQVVGCSAERDVLPLVLAQCNYSLMVGQAATLDYDFAAFQQHLTDSLLQCKARIYRAPAGYIPVETMVFKADTTSSRLFNIMRKKIEQECLSPAERRQIVEDLRDNLPDICQSIDNLNTALSFLKALGGNPDVSLHEFMSSSLRMKRTLCSRKAQQLCKLAHVQSLWVLLCYQRACILTAHYQEAFDTLRKELREELTVEQGKELEAACQRMSIDRLELLLLQLFECIMLRLSEPHDGDDDARPENFKLRDMLTSHLECPLYHKEPVEVQSRMLTPEDLTEGESAFPDSLCCRHAAVTWLLCHAHLANKRHQTQF